MRLLLFVVLSLAVAMGATADPADPYPHVQRYLQFVADLKSALERGDSASVALLTDFPLHVNESGSSRILIPDETSLQAHFAMTFPTEVRERIRRTTSQWPRNDGRENFSLDGGLMWLVIVEHEHGPRFRLKTINLPGDKDPVWPRLEMVCETPRHRIVIQRIGAEQSRYRAWNLPRALTEKPDLELEGVSTFEGMSGCQHPVHIFERGNTRITAYQGGCGPSDWPANTIDVEIDDEKVNSWGCL